MDKGQRKLVVDELNWSGENCSAHSMSTKNRKIQIEEWEMGTSIQGLQITGNLYDLNRNRPKCVKTIEIKNIDTGSSFLHLDFQKPFFD